MQYYTPQHPTTLDPVRGMSGKPVDRGLSLPTVAGLADLAVGPESGCPREGFKKRQELDPVWPLVRVRNAA
jgi:hypothetical protein